MQINVNEYSDYLLPGCVPILIDSENFIEFRNHLVDLLGKAITPSEAVRMYEIIASESPSQLIDAREYLLNELQYEIRRTKAAASNTTSKDESEILQDWATSLSERTDGRFYERSDTDDVLDLISAIKEKRFSRKDKY